MMKDPPRFSSAFSALVMAFWARSPCMNPRRRIGTCFPMEQAIWSPVNAPAAATAPRIQKSGELDETNSAASAMITDSLGMGGKNPSIVANAYRAGNTHGVPALYAFATIDGFFPPIPSESVIIALAALFVSSSSPDFWILGAVAAPAAFTADHIAYQIRAEVVVDMVSGERSGRGDGAEDPEVRGAGRDEQRRERDDHGLAGDGREEPVDRG